MRGMEQQLILDFSELSSIGVECARCRTQIIMDVTSEYGDIPERCPACHGEDFNQQGVQSAVKEYVRAYKSVASVLKIAKHRIT